MIPILYIFLGGGYFLLSLVKKSEALLLLIFCWIIVPSYLHLKIGPLPGITLARVFTIAFFLATACRMSIKHGGFNSPSIATQNGYIRAVIAFLFFRIAASFLGSDQQMISLFAWILQTITLLIIPFAVFVALLRKEISMETLSNTIILSFIIICLIGVIELTTGQNLVDMLASTANMQLTDDAVDLLAGRTRDGSRRLQSVFPNALIFGEFLSIMLPLFLMKLLSAGDYQRWLGAGIISLYAICLYGTKSRTVFFLSGIIALLFFIVTALMKKMKLNQHTHSQKMKFGLLILTGLFVFIIFTPATVEWTKGKIIGQTEQEMISSESRKITFLLGIDRIIQKPIIGHGVFRAAPAIGRRAVDNLYITLAIESGVIGLLLFLFSQGYCLFIATILMVNSYRQRNMVIFIQTASFTIGMISFLIFAIVCSLPQVFLLVSLLAVMIQYTSIMFNKPSQKQHLNEQPILL